MASENGLSELAERKRLLILQADLHRAVIHAEVVNARIRLQWLEQARTKLSGGNPWFLGGAAAAGLFAVRHWRKTLKWVPTALAAWRWIRR
jgi:hypothetical protein